jgi:hypothetical protein|tara:strand:+ start:480 stop:701 length:222 start_codon:yes stop_codon:yes gene_type:complete
MNPQIMTLEDDALERLTNERRENGALSPEVEAGLSAIGIYWDDIEEEYFSLEEYQRVMYEHFADLYSAAPNEN